jgi:Tfp pilus assembly major pilin PilA
MLDLIQPLLKLNKRKGFTLVELIISVGTLAIAGTIMIQLFMSAKDMAVRASDLDAGVFLGNRIVESIKAERWEYEPLNEMYTQYAMRYGNEMEKIGFYDLDWEAVDENSKDKVFQVNVTLSSDDEALKEKSLYSLSVEIKRLQPYFKGKDENPFLHSLSTQVYIDTPLEVIEP